MASENEKRLYSSQSLADKIARHYGQAAKRLDVRMVGEQEVSGFLSRLRAAREKAHTKPTKLN